MSPNLERVSLYIKCVFNPAISLPYPPTPFSQTTSPHIPTTRKLTHSKLPPIDAHAPIMIAANGNVPRSLLFICRRRSAADTVAAADGFGVKNFAPHLSFDVFRLLLLSFVSLIKTILHGCAPARSRAWRHQATRRYARRQPTRHLRRLQDASRLYRLFRPLTSAINGVGGRNYIIYYPHINAVGEANACARRS